jgi:hypothetical protein
MGQYVFSYASFPINNQKRGGPKVLNILGLDVNKWVVYIICIVLGTGILAGGYFLWKHGVISTAQLKFNNEQLEKTIEDQNKFIKEKDDISAAQDKALTDATAEKDALNLQLKSLTDFLNSGETAKLDRGSSDILKTTIRKLRAIK